MTDTTDRPTVAHFSVTIATRPDKKLIVAVVAHGDTPPEFVKREEGEESNDMGAVLEVDNLIDGVAGLGAMVLKKLQMDDFEGVEQVFDTTPDEELALDQNQALN